MLEVKLSPQRERQRVFQNGQLYRKPDGLSIIENTIDKMTQCVMTKRWPVLSVVPRESSVVGVV